MRKTLTWLAFLVFWNTFSQKKETIDSINQLYVQGVNIPQDSLISLFQGNLKNAEKISYELGMAGAYSQLSLIYAYQGKYEESTKNTIAGIKIYEKLNQLDKLADYYGSVGYTMKYRDLQMGLFLMQKGKAIAEANNFEIELKDIYNNYGVLKQLNKEPDSALYFFEKSLEIKKRINDSVGIPYSWSNMAGVYGEQGNYQKSREYFNKSLEQRLVWNDSTGMAENYTQLGEVFMEEKKWTEAIPWIQRSLLISLKKQYQNLTQYNYKTLSYIYKKLNNTDSALYYYEKYSVLKDSVHGLKVQESIAKLNIEYETEKRQNEILQQRAQLAEKDLEVRRKNTYLIGGLGMVLVFGFIGYLFYNQQKLKNRQLLKEGELKAALAKIETQNKLQEQRLRISRDLHDNIGAQLTFIISSIDNLKYGFTDIGEKLGDKLSGISSFTSKTIYELRDTIWAMNKENISLEDLQSRIANFIEHAQIASERTLFSFNIDKKVDPSYVFTSLQGMNIYRIIQEAVNNALKYAEASKIEVEIHKTGQRLEILIKDNGTGFDEGHIALGNGIANMKKRASEINGKVTIISKEGKFTKVTLYLPIDYLKAEDAHPD